MSFVYCDQPDGSVTAIEDDVLVVVWPRSDVKYACEVWLREEVLAYSSVATTLKKEGQSAELVG